MKFNSTHPSLSTLEEYFPPLDYKMNGKHIKPEHRKGKVNKELKNANAFFS